MSNYTKFTNVNDDDLVILPETSSEDAGKVLTVDQTGAVTWAAQSSAKNSYAEFAGGYRATENRKFDLAGASEVDFGLNTDNIVVDDDDQYWDGYDCYYIPVAGIYKVVLKLNIRSTEDGNTDPVGLLYGLAKKGNNDEPVELNYVYYRLENASPHVLETTCMYSTFIFTAGTCVIPYIRGHQDASWYASVSIASISFERIADYIEPPDPYNPLGLPDRTIRIQMSSPSDDPATIFTYTEGPEKIFTRVEGTEDQWDCYYDYADWYGMFRLNDNNNRNKLIKVLGANTTTVTGMDYMFGAASYSGNTGLTDIALFDTSNVTTMRYMFADCQSLHSIPQFDLSNVTNMLNMCEDCTSLSEIQIINTGNVTNMGSLFRNTAITSIPDIDTSSAEHMEFMFCDCSKLTDISLSNKFVFTNVTTVQNMFKDCPNVNTGILAAYNKISAISPVPEHTETFDNCGTNTTTGSSELAQIPSDWK